MPDPPGPGLDAAIAFTNTMGLTNGQPFDDLPTVVAAVDWLEQEGFLDSFAAHRERHRFASAPAARAALDAVRGVRSGLRELLHAAAEEREPDPGALTAVNRVLGLREATQLVRGPDGLRLERRREGEPLDRALAEIARRVAAEFDEGRPRRFRICANDRCRWLFYDRSRPGSRRWCEMSSCGNRAKAARHRARLRAKQAPTTG